MKLQQILLISLFFTGAFCSTEQNILFALHKNISVFEFSENYSLISIQLKID